VFFHNYKKRRQLKNFVEKLTEGVYGQPSIFWMKNPSFSIA